MIMLWFAISTCDKHYYRRFVDGRLAFVISLLIFGVFCATYLEAGNATWISEKEIKLNFGNE